MNNEFTKLKSKCVVCKKPLTLHTYWSYHGDPMNMIIGPGSRNQMTESSDILCEKCGLKYYAEPK